LVAFVLGVCGLWGRVLVGRGEGNGGSCVGFSVGVAVA